MSSMFDPQQFLEGAEVTGEMATKFINIPPGRYNMTIKEVTARRIEPDDASKKPFTVLELQCTIAGTELTPLGVPLKEVTGRDENTARYKGFLDFNEGGALALGPGQNVALGAIRAAVNQNSPSSPWRFGMLRGQMFNGEVILRADPKDAEKQYAEVKNPLPRQ